jgi:2-keto-3-deoxy-L-rhamnonate aldolase RhmA
LIGAVRASFTLTAITRDPALADALDAAGVDRIGVDIERLGKAARQGHVAGARISAHDVEDLAALAPRLRRAALFIRINPIHAGSRAEVNRAIALGARVVMLPFFTTTCEVAQFVEFVAGRAACVLLLETSAALARLGDIVAVPGVEEVMVGLNDLHLSLGLAHPFEVLVSDLMELAARRVCAAGLRFGFGGLARIGDDTLPVPPDLVYAQYARLGGSTAWLARSFFAGGALDVAAEVARLRERLAFWAAQPEEAFAAMRHQLAWRLRELRSAGTP